jgi:acetyltransferase
VIQRDVLDRVFDPRSIAVVGASANPAKRGHQILRALAESGYTGAVHPVNPRGGHLLGLEVVPSISELPDGVDLAVFCTPAAAAPQLVRECGARHIGGAVVLAVGYGESGVAGQALEEELRTAARDSGVRIIGPNTSGLLNLTRGVNLVGARGVRSGGLAFVVQSGNVALSLMNEVTERSWDGVSIYLGVGNEVDVGFADALSYLGTNDETRAVITYIEGLRDPRAFLEVAAGLSGRKPIVAIKSGRTHRGAQAALSHTGAVAGPYDRLSAGLAQAGVVEVTRTDELLHVAETLGRQPACPPDRALAILSDGGGQGTLAADVLAEAGATLASLSTGTTSALRTLLGPAAAVSNPVDLAGAADADPEVFGRALEILMSDTAVGGVLLIGLFGGYGVRFSDTLTEGETRAADLMVTAAARAGSGLVVHSMYAAHRTRPLELLGRAGVPVIASLEVACRCVVELQRRGRTQTRAVWVPLRDGETERPPPHPAIVSARASGRRTLSEPEARAVLETHGVSFPEGRIVASPAEAAEAFSALGGRAVLKVVSEHITHKSDAGGVVLNIDTPSAAATAFEQIGSAAANYATTHGLPSEPPRAFLTLMHGRPRVEVLVGATRDPTLGSVLTVGAGGIWVEAAADVAHRVLPIDDTELEAMLFETRAARLLAAGRGHAAVDPAIVLGVMRGVANALAERPEIEEVEINPLFVFEGHSVPIDARVVLGDDPPE